MSIVTAPCHRTGQKSRLAVLLACAAFALVPAASLFGAGVDRPTDRSGLIFAAMDRSVRPQDDFYGYANGAVAEDTPIPPDKSSYGLDNELTDLTLDQLHGILDKAAAAPRPPGSETQKIGDLYASFMDESHIEMLGVHPLDAELEAVQDVHDLEGLANLFRSLPADRRVHALRHRRDAGCARLHQVRVGSRPGRPRSARSRLLPQGGRREAQGDPAEIPGAHPEDAESAGRCVGHAGGAADRGSGDQLAHVQWTQVENRDPVKTYNKLTLARLRALVPQYDWQGFLAADDLQGKLNSVIVSQPTYLHALGKILQETPLPVWKSYARWHLVSTFARYLSHPFADEDFAFYGTVVRGTPTNEVRWKRRRWPRQGRYRRGPGQGVRRAVLPARDQSARARAGEQPDRHLSH